ncbi:hypothetical protein NEUTE1DRAFT_86475 [Neurospora tetrasperma FGSC 2508]|uniref:Uncharacterized protein n=1 Tax=Neurospora tetrasperma (strain FGSC 2508 / ATCC MYA-4615 / P0657) TaxID=510951 RepID=F8MRU9_NEUT8|nr:uncharacterized protein NEUTE1DRAFT_86475 [Neurospora tetrasperma FGSC 2508]EGO55795.1 hypothetical protein NEUTE1DRAFT_86475 [Neurospora tetrasperma FGSC 2508]EGZ68951.1 hypothetical protein NEUTE2DRAFT_114931 [Neurospora tetrasperma FGSC 2509]
MARYESLHGNHDDEEEDHVTHNEVGDHDEDDEQRHTESSRSSKSSYTAVEQDDEEGNAASRAVYAALYGGGGGSPPSGGPVHVSGDRQTGTGDDHHHQLNTPPPVLQHPGPFDAPLIPPKSPARSTNKNPFLSNVNVTNNITATTTSTPASNQQATDHQTHGSGSSRNASGEPGTTSRSASRDSTNYVNQYSRSWKPSYGLPHSRDHHHHHHHPGHSPFSPLPETAEVEGDYHHHHHHGHHRDDHHDYHDHDHDSSDDPHDLDQDDYIMYEKETGGGMATTPRSTTGRGGPGTGSFKEKGGRGGGKGGMRKLMLVERTDTKRGRGGGRGRRGTEMSEVSIDATDSISVRGLPTHGSGGGGGGSGSPSALTPGVVGGGMNRSEQHLSYFHFDSTETLVQIIGLVLSIYDHKPPPSTWPGGLNLNVFLSFMTTLATACYMIPVIEGLGQLRWLRYTGGRQTVSRPASDFEAIDQASRGLHHCWRLLGFQGGPLGILASLITFLTLFTPSLTQLLITYLPPQPHRNNPGEPFDSNRSAVTLVRINWSWLAFLLVQVLLSAIFLTTIIVKTRMEGIQIFKTSALPGMTALDGQARSSLGGAMMGQGGIMTSAALGERAKKTILKLERSSGATGGGGNYGLVQGFVVDSSAGSNSGSHGSGSGSGSGSAGMGLRVPKGLGLGLGLERFRHHDHQVLPSYDKEGGGEGCGGHQAFGNGPAENLSFPAAAAAAAGFTPLPMPMSKAKPMPISTTVPASTALSGRRKMRFSLFGGAGREKLKVRGSPVHASNGGGQF